MPFSEKKIIEKHIHSFLNSEEFRILQLPQSGSSRKYFRVLFGDKTFIAAYNNNVFENEAFLSFTESFQKIGLPVPIIYFVSDDRKSYILEDYGNELLIDKFLGNKEAKDWGGSSIDLMKSSLWYLAKFQTEGNEVVDFTKCVPRSEFDRRSIIWDLNYFKYNFLKTKFTDIDEDELENEFEILINRIQLIENNYFMYRDFQSRNIMVKDDKLFFIDYQGGRKGPSQYDLASFLYQARAGIPESIRCEMKEYYISELSKKVDIDRKKYLIDFDIVLLLRQLQTLGAYGFRGYFEGKQHFLQSIPQAILNIQNHMNSNLDISIPYLKKLINALEPDIKNEQLNLSKLNLNLFSFSYKNGIPSDPGNNGGGFVFDCRGMPNPGREKYYRAFTGKDTEVIEFFQDKMEIFKFIENCKQTVQDTVDNYLNRNFANLTVSFGCTGGQHRSVFCAENFAKHFLDNDKINVVLHHREFDI